MSIKTTHSLEQQCEPNTINKKTKSNHSDIPNNNISLTFSLLSNPDSLNVATHNIVSFNDPIKQEQIIHNCTLNNIDILGISETNIPNDHIKHINKSLDKTYTYFFNSARSKCRGNGVGLIINSSIASNIFYHHGKHGRYIFIDLQLKNKRKMRIFQIYLHANNRDIKDRIIVQNEIIKHIDYALNKNYDVIVMGDFNVDYNKSKHNNVHRQQKLKFIEDLSQRNLIDSINILDQHQHHINLPTWTSADKSIQSRIDYIFFSSSLTNTFLYSDIVTPELYRSDHNMVIMMLKKNNLFQAQSLAQARRNRQTKLVYFYNKMNKEKWESFSAATDSMLHNHSKLRNLTDSNLYNTTCLNEYWTYIREIITGCAKTSIPNKNVTTNGRDAIPKETVDLQDDISKLNKVFHQFNNKQIDQPMDNLNRNWPEDIVFMNSIINKYQLPHYTNKFDSLITNINFKSNKKGVHHILGALLAKYKLEHKKTSDDQIKKYIEQRCTNLKDSPKKMLDSLLNRDKRFIVMDRIIINKDGEQVLLTDEASIKKATNDHFQRVAGSKNESKEFSKEWAEWKNEYRPKDDIDSSIYKDLMSPPSKSEWYAIIQQLPKGKASGPSGISNEMLQHLGPSMFDKLWIFIKATLKLSDFPAQWKEAHIYPIPKPQEWHHNLNNTRPITLLDTTRKAVVKLLNNRLSSIFVQRKILKGYNFAALPHSSTFEALRVIDNVLQDAKDNKKEIWFLLQDMSKAYDRVNIHMLRHALNRLKLPVSFQIFIENLFTNRWNSVFTPFGLTDKYNTLVGIDQGEVICPLLWCIYYDPLLSFVQKSDLGFNMQLT